MSISPNDHIIIYAFGETLICFRLNSTKQALVTHTKYASINGLAGNITQPSSSCSFISSTSKFTLLPGNLFNALDKQLILDKVCHVGTSDHLFYNSVSLKKQIDTAFYLPKETVEKVLSFWPMATFSHHSSLVFDRLKSGLHVNLANKQMEIAYITDETVEFYNVFDINNKEESLYYLSAALEKNKLPLKHTEINLIGDVDVINSITSFWKKYIPAENIKTTQVNTIDTSIDHLTIP